MVRVVALYQMRNEEINSESNSKWRKKVAKVGSQKKASDYFGYYSNVSCCITCSKKDIYFSLIKMIIEAVALNSD